MPIERLKIEIVGSVQGVGFRPFVWRMATRWEMSGWVRNRGGAVEIEAEGDSERLGEFVRSIRATPPAGAEIRIFRSLQIPPQNDRLFKIERSTTGDLSGPCISSDLAPCDACLRELLDPENRRYLYPFISCIACGPRFTIATRLPYDRANTTMAPFAMCEACCDEYHAPEDRRFHAQSLSCHLCGPHLSWNTLGSEHSDLEAEFVVRARQQHVLSVLRRFGDAIAHGKIVAVKGSGGFQLVCDATSRDAVGRLRNRKKRHHKPFAILVPDVASAESQVHLNEIAKEWLCSPVAPIVIGRNRSDATEPDQTHSICSNVSFVDSTLGVMLPSSPLYHLLIDACRRPLVVTSGNLSEEPMVIENDEAWTRLRSIADDFLFHDLDIVQPCDDSIIRAMHDESIIVRMARGMVPKAFPLPSPLPAPLTPTTDFAEPERFTERFTERANAEVGLALGSDLKTALCISQAGCATLYQPIGDAVHLETLRTLEDFSQHIQSITKAECDVVLCDLHPDYVTHDWAQKYAKTNACKVHAVQHHHAHLAALAAEHGYHSGREICGFVFDGTGYGGDGTSMGGEVLFMRDGVCRRIGHLKHALLPGGDLCAKHPAKTALAMLVSCGLAWDSRLACVRAVDHEERVVLAAQLERSLNCVLSSSMGRLFDAISSILDLRHLNDFESHAALALEGLGTRWMERGLPNRWDAGDGPKRYSFAFQKDRDPFLIDPTPVLKNIVRDVLDGVNFEQIAFEYHVAVATVIADISEWVKREGENREIGITGGVFQNSLLVHLTRQMLNRRGIIPWTHQRLTPNDGSLGVGQAWVRAESIRRRSSK